jgi:hypothetical protein
MLIPAFKGEFGLKLRYHVPRVYALGAGHVIEIEAGEEALYPLAKEWRVVPRGNDDRRYGPGATHPGKAEQRFVPEPYVRQGVAADVVICPRKRNYGAQKNWPHWFHLSCLPGVFAAGAPDSSFDVDCPRAWDYARFLDASIEALRSARLCIATDAGLAHLAVLCGTPLLIITYRGLVAPGPIMSFTGRMIKPAYWPVKFDEYYAEANHTGSPIELIDGWEHPERVVERVLELTAAEDAA